MFNLFRKNSQNFSKETEQINLHKERLQALLTEYSCLRAEAQHEDTHQIQLVALTFTMLGVAVTATATCSEEFLTLLSKEICLFLFIIVFPFLIMFMGLIWIDLIYRRVRFGVYTIKLENKINRLLRVEAGNEAMEWEHWIKKLDNGRKIDGISNFFNLTGFFRGYVISGCWLSAPLLIIWLYFIFTGYPLLEELKEIYQISCNNRPLSAVTIFVYAVYYFLFMKYIKRITDLQKVDP